LLTDHRRVADWPRSIVEGSALNSAIETLGGGGGAGCSTFGGGGGGGGGTFFLHAADNSNRVNPSKTMLIFRVLIVNSPP